MFPMCDLQNFREAFVQSQGEVFCREEKFACSEAT